MSTSKIIKACIFDLGGTLVDRYSMNKIADGYLQLYNELIA